jgi:tetraacyldisaccharide 4'-kinase
VNSVDALREEILRLAGERPIFQSLMRPVRLSSLKNPSETLAAPARVAAFCAVGNPYSFFENVRGLDFELALQKSFPDHHFYSQDEIDALIRDVKDTGATSLITTAKDAVKLRTLSFSIPCYVLNIEISIENPDAFTRMLFKAADSRG